MKLILAAGLVALTAAFGTAAHAQVHLQDEYDIMNKGAPLTGREQNFAPVIFLQGDTPADVIGDMMALSNIASDTTFKQSAILDYRNRMDIHAPFAVQAQSGREVIMGWKCLVRSTTGNLADEINAFAGMDALTARRYRFEIPPAITRESWDIFKSHIGAGLCVKPNHIVHDVESETEREKEQFNSNLYAIVFAAVMSARQGHPQIIPFVADLYAATFLHAEFYPGQKNHFLRAARYNGASNISIHPRKELTYPSFALDALNQEWLSEKNPWKDAPLETMYARIEKFLNPYYFSLGQYTALTALRDHYKYLDAFRVESEAIGERMQKRAEKGAKNLHVCLTLMDADKQPAPSAAERDLNRWSPGACRQALLNRL